jgi:predicted lipoprotein with Yx(FWY)xxD motif
MPVAAIVGLATAGLVGVAFAKTFTLHVVRNATVMNTAGTTKHESIVVNPRGRAVYALSGDSQHHPECTKASGCFKFWPPVTVSSAKKLNKGPGVAGRLGVWHRNGLVQVTLAGHPLYAFAADAHKGLATGEGLRSFGGTWHVIKASAAKPGTTTTPAGSTTTSTTPCLYPPCH